MRVVKAVVVREPLASRLAAGEETAAYKGFRTDHRGETLIVGDEDPWYGLALADLVEVRPISADDVNAPIGRGFVWSFKNATRLSRFRAGRRSGLYTVEIPEGALPAGLQTRAVETADPAPPVPDDAVKVTVARELRMARAGLRTTTRGLGELRDASLRQGQRDGAHAALTRFETVAAEILARTEELVTDMVRLDAIWRRELDPPRSDSDAVAGYRMSEPLTTRRERRLDILVVEDEPKMARGVQRSLSIDHDVRIATSKREALIHIRDRVPDVLLCDHRLEWQKTDDLFEYVRDQHPRVRRVLYSFSHLEVWSDLLQRKLIDAVVPKSAPRNALLAALF